MFCCLGHFIRIIYHFWKVAHSLYTFVCCTLLVISHSPKISRKWTFAEGCWIFSATFGRKKYYFYGLRNFRMKLTIYHSFSNDSWYKIYKCENLRLSEMWFKFVEWRLLLQFEFLAWLTKLRIEFYMIIWVKLCNFQHKIRNSKP